MWYGVNFGVISDVNSGVIFFHVNRFVVNTSYSLIYKHINQLQ